MLCGSTRSLESLVHWPLQKPKAVTSVVVVVVVGGGGGGVVVVVVVGGRRRAGKLDLAVSRLRSEYWRLQAFV